MKGNRIITIGRQIGSGGSEIGMEVAKRLGIRCYDKQLIELACNYGELDQDVLAAAEEKRPNPFLYSVPRQMQNDKTGRGIAINDMVFNVQSEVIRQLAEKESCVIVGRCVNYVFKDRPNTLRVFVHAPWEFRVEKSREKISGSDEEIEKFLRRDDKRKQDYYRKFAGGDWSDATNYDLCLNAGKLGFEKCVDAILAQMNVMGIK